MRRIALLVLAGGFLFITALAAYPQDTEIRGAAIALVPRTVVVDRVTIENRRASPLVAWEVQFSADDGVRETTGSDFVLQIPAAGAPEHSIKSGERRTIEMPAQEGRTRGSPLLQLAVFEDGHIAGVPEVVARWQRARQEHMDEVAYWIRALSMMPRDSEESARQYLAARVAERPALASSKGAGLRGRVLDIWQPFSGAEPSALFARAERIREEAERHLATLRRTSVLSPTFDAATPVLVSSDRIARTDYMASIANHRDVPLEAVGFEILAAGEDRPSSGHSSDFCLSDVVVGPASTGRIAAGDTREFPLPTAIGDASRLPTLRLTFVLFDDLSFEGSIAERDRLFQLREHQADDIAFANRVRMELAALPADAVHGFLVEKRAERTRELVAEGRRPGVRFLDEMIDEARRSPERLRETALVATQILEDQRHRLLRHVR